MSTMTSLHISVMIRREATEVSAFAAAPDVLPRWAAGQLKTLLEQGP